MMHVETRIVYATKKNTCEHCGGDIEPNMMIVFYEVTRTVGHVQCHLATRRSAL